MSTLEELSKTVADLARRLQAAETKLSMQAGQFEFIITQLRDVQLYLHARFEDIDQRFAAIDQKLKEHDKRFDGIDRRLDTIDARLEALPRVLAELLSKRRPRSHHDNSTPRQHPLR